MIGRVPSWVNGVDWTMRQFLDAQYCPRQTKVVLKRAFTRPPKSKGAVPKSGTRRTDPVDQLERSEAMERLEQLDSCGLVPFSD